jgi:hypothetical protein
MKNTTFKYTLLLLCILCLPMLGLAQADVCKEKSDQGFILWFNCRIEKTVSEKMSPKIAAKISQRNVINQSETPSIAGNSSALVDTSSAADFVGVGLNLAGLTSNSSDMKATAMSVTVSAYAFKASAAKRDPLDPAFYNANRDWRKLSVTLGFEYPEGMQGNPNAKTTIFGVKYLPLNKRDASHHTTLINGISTAVSTAAEAINRIVPRVRNYLFNLAQSSGKLPPGITTVQEFAQGFNNQTTWKTDIYPLIGAKELRELDEIIAQEVPALVILKEKSIEAAETIRTSDQISFQYLTKQRRDNMPDEHKLESIFDIGITGRGNFSMNASFDYIDNKMAEDIKGGSFAAALQYQLSRDQLEGRMPLLLTFSADGKWMTKMTPTYKAQAKLSIPLAEGIEIPLSVTVASRTDLIKEADVKGKIGFTIDVSRLADRFKAGLFGKK